MTDTLVDTNVLIDISDDGEPWFAWSAQVVADATEVGQIVINQVVYSELVAGYARREELDATLGRAGIRREGLPWDAAFLAGVAFQEYRRRGGRRQTLLPDFYIGAHALLRGYRLATRDQGAYRSYFPTLDIIAPDTHP